MIGRRQILRLGLVTAMWPALALAEERRASVGFAAPARWSLYKGIYDARYPACVAFAEWMKQSGVPIWPLDHGDVTGVWFNDLALRWREEPAAIAGMTAPEALFCLEELARDHRMRVTFSAWHRLRSDGLIEHRVCGPVALPDDILTAENGTGWCARMAELAMQCPRRRAALLAEPLLVIGDGSGMPRRPPGALVSWIIAPVART
ncbi:MAG TPA: hypothetical protein VIM81_14780 [Gammaproteobacteria bacterium]